MATAPERRNERADDAATALRLKLAYARREAALEAVVIANEEGLLLAQDGDPELCEELAAMAPLLSLGQWEDSVKTDFVDTQVSVRPFSVDGSDLFLAWSGSPPEPSWLESANSGVRRILTTC